MLYLKSDSRQLVWVVNFTLKPAKQLGYKNLDAELVQ